MLKSSPSQDEREAYLFADIASAADAGISAEQILNGPSTASLPGVSLNTETLTEGLVAKGLQLAPHELLMLETAEQAGNLSKVLRILASQRTLRAERHREIRRRLAYPVFLLCFAGLVGCISSWALSQGPWLIITATAIVLGALGVAVLVVRQTIQDPDRGLIPPIRRLVLDLGELPYLQSMHGLYGAGVKVHEAHALALKTSPVASVRQRLEESGRALARGSTLSEALHLCTALHPETRQMLASAEAAGDLEHALDRAVKRRQNATDLNSRRLMTIGLVAIQVFVYGFAGYVVLNFWLSYYAGIGMLR